jgi:hypothetical protein
VGDHRARQADGDPQEAPPDHGRRQGLLLHGDDAEQERDLVLDPTYQTIVSGRPRRATTTRCSRARWSVVQGVVYYSHNKVFNTLGLSSGSKWGSGSTVDGAQAMLLGAQAAGIATARQHVLARVGDHRLRNRPGVGVGRKIGMLKPQFKSLFDELCRQPDQAGLRHHRGQDRSRGVTTRSTPSPPSTSTSWRLAASSSSLPGVVASGNNEIPVNTSKKEQVATIPFSAVDQGGDATETDTGFDVPTPAFVMNRLHGFGLNVTVVHAGKTIDVGLGEVHPAETGGDANGFIAGSSVATAGLVIGTDGALFSTNAPHKSDA